MTCVVESDRSVDRRSSVDPDKLGAKAGISPKQSFGRSVVAMVDATTLVDRNSRRRVFEAWSVEIPSPVAETFVDGSSWHAYDDDRPVSTR